MSLVKKFWLAELGAVGLSSRALVRAAVVRARAWFSLVSIQPPALSSLEWNVKLQMGEQSAP